MKSDNPNVQRWLENEHFQNFLRQVHTDIYVGSKNGVKPTEIQEALEELNRQIMSSVGWLPANSGSVPVGLAVN